MGNKLDAALQILKMYEDWEADLLNSDDFNLIDVLDDELYERLLEIQKLRNEVLCQ